MGIDAAEKKRRNKGKYPFLWSPLTHSLKEDRAYWLMNPSARDIYQYLLMSYNRRNNGKLTAPFSVLQELGIIGSEQTLSNALRELREAGFIRLVAKGAKKLHLANRYAITNPPIAIDWNPQEEPEDGYFIPP